MLMHTSPLPCSFLFLQRRAGICGLFLLYNRPEGGINGQLEGEIAGLGSCSQFRIATC